MINTARRRMVKKVVTYRKARLSRTVAPLHRQKESWSSLKKSKLRNPSRKVWIRTRVWLVLDSVGERVRLMNVIVCVKSSRLCMNPEVILSFMAIITANMSSSGARGKRLVRLLRKDTLHRGSSQSGSRQSSPPHTLHTALLVCAGHRRQRIPPVTGRTWEHCSCDQWTCYCSRSNQGGSSPLSLDW